jgi:hypothetical protein
MLSKVFRIALKGNGYPVDASPPARIDAHKLEQSSSKHAQRDGALTVRTLRYRGVKMTNKAVLAIGADNNPQVRRSQLRNDYDGYSLERYERKGKTADLLPYLDAVAEKMSSRSSPMSFSELARAMFGIQSIPLEHQDF